MRSVRRGGALAQIAQLVAHLAQLGHLGCHLLALGQQAAVAVEHVEVGARVEEREARVLAVDIDEAGADLAQGGVVDGATVDAGHAAATLGVDLAGDDELVVVVFEQVVLAQQGSQVWVVIEAEDPLDAGALAACAHPRHVALLAA